MKRKQLESYLQDVAQFSHPKLELEQYPTDPHLAASVLYTAQTSFGDIEDKAVLDMGAGCGILSIGSVMLGAGSVTSLELDSDAIQDLQDNITEFEIDNIDIIQCDVTTDLVRKHSTEI
ncbi:rRNA N6-adenosine-methyltransferase METTL5-like [Bolinopsis microptera]|uniref:rRNA N6-adenosine-methyltransferase METTL5-like n=1 Tax=Bolinopsis microptera TaxID=2820187 RepID=UPI003079ACB9